MGMRSLGKWGWVKHTSSKRQVETPRNIIKCEKLIPVNKPPINWDEQRRHDNLIIVGDGNTMLQDIMEFESWDIPHDIYCVNRAMVFFQRQVDHWAAIDSEESIWFVEHLKKDIMPERPIFRHTLGVFPNAYDVFWKQDYPITSEFQYRVWIGNTGYFALLTAIHMGYKKIVCLGMPLNHEPHWYERPNDPPPMWAGLAFTQWMDFKIKRPGTAEKVRSMSGYSAFILGKPTKEWFNGESNATQQIDSQ